MLPVLMLSAAAATARATQSVKPFWRRVRFNLEGSAMLESYGMLGNWEIRWMGGFEMRETLSPHCRGGLEFLK